MGGIPEVTALREWEDKHQEELEEKSQKEDGEKKQRREAAYKEIQQWKEDRDQNISKKRTTNREDEKAFKDATEKKPTSDNPWERVVDLIDTNARSSDDSRDVSRMRSLLIHLKSSPPEKDAEKF